jgi:hypothetical protein
MKLILAGQPLKNMLNIMNQEIVEQMKMYFKAGDMLNLDAFDAFMVLHLKISEWIPRGIFLLLPKSNS